MSSNSVRPVVFGLRLATWYATLFVLAAIAIRLPDLLRHRRLARAARSPDPPVEARRVRRRSIGAAGCSALTETVRAEQLTAPERLFVRVVDRRSDVLVLSMPRRLGPATARNRVTAAAERHARPGRQEHRGAPRSAGAVPDRARARHAVHRRHRTGGRLAGDPVGARADSPADRGGPPHRAHRPDRRAGRRCVSTHDAIYELTALFNAMLDRIEGLVSGMHGALDNVSHDLRTPLTRLRGVGGDGARAARPTPSVTARRWPTASRSRDRVLVMLNTLMDISEAESGAMPLVRETDPARRTSSSARSTCIATSPKPKACRCR